MMMMMMMMMMIIAIDAEFKTGSQKTLSRLRDQANQYSVYSGTTTKKKNCFSFGFQNYVN